MNNKKIIKYEECFVAFLDILGFKNKVFETKNNKSLLNHLIETLRFNQYFTTSDNKKINDGRKIAIRSYFFSDSFVFFMKENDKDLPHLFLIIRYLQDRFWESDLCLRGAITKGNMYWPEDKNENIILGPAMIDAYKLESQIAIYPRIILSDSLVDYINNHNIKAKPISNNPGKLKAFIRRGEDGVYFFDTLHPHIVRKQGEKVKQYRKTEQENRSFTISWNNNAKSNYGNIFIKVREIATNGIKNKDDRIKQKYEWLKSYSESWKTKRKLSDGR